MTCLSIFNRSAFLFAWLAFCLIATATPEQTAKLEFFESKIRPVLVEQCYKCHSVESGKSKGDLRLDSRTAWQVGGESGPAVIPGNPEDSLLIKAISRADVIPEMPPKSHLSPSVIADFTQWIANGAVDPREGDAPVHEKETIDIEAGRKFWSFQPRQTFSEKNSIDGFVDPQAVRAPAEKLARRLYLDLIGLPPTPDDLATFTRIYHEQSNDKAISETVDQLLARKEFGEKWARHWLDVARYADSNGGDFNLTFHESWRYRNYIIDALNSDLPYDQFLREQIAGDLLPFDTPDQRDRQLIATGFLMIAPKMLTERNKPKMHLDIADEQVDTIGRTIMGLTLGCARCHDHKFDPIPTADYYSLAGILHSTRTADGILMNNVNVTGWTETNLSVDPGTAALISAHQTKVDKLQKEVDRYNDDTGKKSKISGLEAELKELKKNFPEVETAMAAADHTDQRLGDLHIRIRGETNNRGKLAPRGFLQVASYSGRNQATIPQGESGRLQLAEWLTHPDHPLTARVIVNRIWQQLFGRGIVATSDNFGRLGASPSHPELLDYLAEKLVASDWSIKSLIREIINSKTWQQTAQTASEDDPDNQLLHHQNRRPAPAETIRDSILAIAGELDREACESVVGQLGMHAIATGGKRDASLGQTGKLRQRSIYMPIVRGAVPPSLAIFDLPNPDMVTGKRSDTTVPAQALFMMNSPFVQEMAGAVSDNVIRDNLSIEEIIQQLYLRILIRHADTGDIEMAKEYITRLTENGSPREQATASFVQILFSSTEFRFIE